jgi:hypothetical protein
LSSDFAYDGALKLEGSQLNCSWAGLLISREFAATSDVPVCRHIAPAAPWPAMIRSLKKKQLNVRSIIISRESLCFPLPSVPGASFFSKRFPFAGPRSKNPGEFLRRTFYFPTRKHLHFLGKKIRPTNAAG